MEHFWLLAVFIFSLVIQFYYYARYFLAVPSHNEKVEPNTPPVSIIVAAHNEENNLPELLESLITQDYPEFEIIIVNDRSEDNTEEILNEFQSSDQRVSAIHIKETPSNWNAKKYALKTGIQQAQHEWLLFTDADCVATDPNWIKAMAGKMTESAEIVLGFSPYKARKGFLNQIIQYETLFTAFQYISFALKGKPYMGVGRNLAYRKALFEKSGFEGYAHRTGGDDDLFVNQNANSGNTKVCIDSDSFMLSKPKTTWKEYFTQKIRHLSAGKHYQQKDQTRLGVFALSNWVGWLSFFALLLASQNWTVILILYSLRSLSFYIIFTRTGQKLNVKLAYWTLPLLELGFWIFYSLAGLFTLTTKRIKWS